MPGFGSVGVWEVVVILMVVLLVFGAKRIPEIGAAMGKGIREFKSSIRDLEGEIRNPAERQARDLPRSEAPRIQDGPPKADEATRPAEAAARPADADRPTE